MVAHRFDLLLRRDLDDSRFRRFVPQSFTSNYSSIQNLFKKCAQNSDDFNGGKFIMFYRWICCLWKMMGLAFIAFLFDIYQVIKIYFRTFFIFYNFRIIWGKCFSRKKTKSLFSKTVRKAIENIRKSLEQEAADEIIADDEDDVIVRATRSKRTRRIESSDCHKAAQKSVYALKNAVHPTDVVFNQ